MCTHLVNPTRFCNRLNKEHDLTLSTNDAFVRLAATGIALRVGTANEHLYQRDAVLTDPADTGP
ncbi:hypothetical protein KCP78_22670 [Salmonella enterica subsp. enterica]|nr:hypothetical protein KCP78_22670 [Salmonella enterica subsp. enterica]